MDKELIILEQIQNNPHVNQRDLATVAQASLGMINAILKRFAQKGLITVKKINNRNIRYALTSQGMEEINRRSWNYFKRTIKNVVDYQDAVMEVVRQAAAEGYEGIALVGESDLAFIVEHVCYKLKVPYSVYTAENPLEGWFYVDAETEVAGDGESRAGRFSLNLLLNRY